MTIIVGHATFCVVIAYNNVIARLRRLPRIAGGGLGRPRRRTSWTTFRRITLPRLGTALLSGGLLAFALSFDEIIVTHLHRRSGHPDDPDVDLSRRSSGPNELPVVNVVAFVLILLSIVPVWLAQRISGAETAGARL